MKTTHEEHVRAVIAVLHGTMTPRTSESTNPSGLPDAARFVTISRQAGEVGKTQEVELDRELNRLNPRPRHRQPWTVWDHELVEKVSSEHHIPEELVEALEYGRHPWFQELIQSFSADCPP